MSETQTITASAMTLPLEIASATDVGRQRELNEDSVWATPILPADANPWQLSGLLLVADGMGGHQAGEVASNLAMQTARQIFESGIALPDEELSGQKLLERVSQAVQEINRIVYQIGDGNGAARPGTTLTLCLARPHEFVIGHAGDSRAYLIRRNEVEQVTQDDSSVAEMVRRGLMTEEEARTSQFRNQITKAIGLRPDIEPTVYYGNWQSGDVLLLCSDGLTEYVTPHEMLQLVQSGDSLQQVCAALIDKANAGGGHDNISVAAARLLDTQTGNAARKPQTWPPTSAPAPLNALNGHAAFDENEAEAQAEQAASQFRAARKRRQQIGVICLLLFLISSVGAWLRWRSQQPPGKTQKQAAQQSEIIIPSPVENVENDLASRRASDSPVIEPRITIWPVSDEERDLRGCLRLSCDRYQVIVTSKTRPASGNPGAPLRGAEEPFKGWVKLKDLEATLDDVQAGKSSFVINGSKGNEVGRSTKGGKISGIPVRLNQEYQLRYKTAKSDKVIAVFRVKLKTKKTSN
ncbi:MAG TPA: PP2C family serine/threonine-protein phosphatase [Abditibacteriaceae bacterium]